jgi:hypothetical protein
VSSSPYFVPLIVSNLFALVLLIAAIFWPRLVRWSFAILFFAAGLVNATLAIRQPELYVESYGSTALLGIYRDFINGIFSTYATSILLAIALGQLLVAVFLIRDGALFRLGVVGACLFLVAIAPLGLGSAFPSTLIMVAAVVMMAYNLIKMGSA